MRWWLRPKPHAGQPAMGRAVVAGKVVTIGVATERWEPYEARVSRTVLRGPGGETPPGYSLVEESSDFDFGSRSLGDAADVLRAALRGGKYHQLASTTTANTEYATVKTQVGAS